MNAVKWESYPADGKTTVGDGVMPPAWDIQLFQSAN